MQSNYLLKIIFLLLFLLSAACGGKSNATGEVVPIENVCSYDRAKPLAVEGYIEPKTMQCERVKTKRGSTISGCYFMMYSNQNRTGAGVPVYINASGSWIMSKNNRIEDPGSYSGDIPAYDGKGKLIPKVGLRIYDNDENLIPEGSKIRIYGTMRNSETCAFPFVERIEKVS